VQRRWRRRACSEDHRQADLAEQASTAFGVGGVGGSFAYGDSATGIAFAPTKNRLTADFSTVAQISQIVSESLVPAHVGARGA
jgi:CubicO group peptidase (beta-lactamase class C family)